MPLKNFIKTIFHPSGDRSNPPPLDGEIVYSKNNVCVHPPGLLASAVEHHRGYLTVYAKISGQSTSLVLNWIPNKRLTHGKNPVQDQEVIPMHSKSLSCVNDINPSLLRVPCSQNEQSPDSAGGEFTKGGTMESTSRVLSNAEELLSSSAALREEILAMEQHTADGISELSDASISSGSTEGPDSDTETDFSYEEPEIVSDPGEPPSELNLEILSLSEKDGVEGEGGGENHQGNGNNSFAVESNSSEPSSGSVVRSSAFDSDSTANDSSSNKSAEAQADETNGQAGDDALDLRLHSPDGDPKSPCAEYNMQFPENSISFVSTPSSICSSDGSSSLPYKGRVKRPAKDQACGVFTVDLALMRSLRLFFSNDACNSGQLVIASQESQYKILHFHCGGLDALATILEQWKLAVKLNEKLSGQYAIQHFSICGPQLSVGQCHPEEGLYRRLSRDAWSLHINEFGQIEDEYNIRKAVFFGGMDPSLRSEVWLFLLKCYPFSSTEFERQAIKERKEKEYQAINEERSNMSKEGKLVFFRSVACIVEKDVLRTDRANPYYRGDNNPNLPILRRILLNYAVYAKTGYTQGMSDLLSPLLIELKEEAETFWCFVGLMQRTIFISSPKDDDMEKQLMYLRELLRIMHRPFYDHLLTCGPDAMELLFVHRWILLCFKREFYEHEALMMWESCWAHYQTDYFHLFICVAIISLYGLDVVENKLASDEMLLHFSNLSMQMNGLIVLRKARGLLHSFRVLARIPCTLHDICVHSAPGIWDSGYSPVVECTGMHGEESCGYGGRSASKTALSEVVKKSESKIRNFFR